MKRKSNVTGQDSEETCEIFSFRRLTFGRLTFGRLTFGRLTFGRLTFRKINTCED